MSEIFCLTDYHDQPLITPENEDGAKEAGPLNHHLHSLRYRPADEI